MCFTGTGIEAIGYRKGSDPARRSRDGMCNNLYCMIIHTDTKIVN